MDIDPLVLYLLFVYCLMIPYGAVKGYSKLLKEGMPDIPRKKLYVRTILMLLLLTALPALVLYYLREFDLLTAWQPKPIELVMGVLLLIGWFASRELLMPWLKKTSPPNSPIKLPLTWRQLALWGAVSLTAGICEEIIYRGVLFSCLLWYVDSAVLAAMISAAVFAVAHIGQGPRSTYFIFFLALSFHWLVWISGSLYTAMIVHAAFDFAVGLRSVLAHQKALKPA